MNPSIILVVHPEVEKKQILKAATNHGIEIIITDRLKSLPITIYTERIAFVYHKHSRFPFTYNCEQIDYRKSEYMSTEVKTLLSKHIKIRRTIDLLSCNLPDYAKEELKIWSKDYDLNVQYSIDPTGAYPGNWIMEETTEGQVKVDIMNVYFTDYIQNWDVQLNAEDSTGVIFKHDDANERFAKCFIHHKTTRMITLNKDLNYNDFVVANDDGIDVHSYIHLPNGYIFNGNGHVIDLSGLPPNVKWNGFIECGSTSHFINNKNVIKNVGIKSNDFVNNSSRLTEGSGYIIRKGQTFFDVYDCFAEGNISKDSGGICGSETGSDDQSKYNIPLNDVFPNETDIKIYSCYVKTDTILESGGGIVGKNSGWYSSIKIHSCFVTSGRTEEQLAMPSIKKDAGGIVGEIEKIDFGQNYSTTIQVYSCFQKNHRIGDYAGGIFGKIDVSDSVSGLASPADSSYVILEIKDCYLTCGIDGSGGAIIGNIASVLEDSVRSVVDEDVIIRVVNNFSQDFSDKLTNDLDGNLFSVTGNNDIQDLSGITDVSFNQYGLYEMYERYNNGNGDIDTYPYLKSFHHLYSIDGSWSFPPRVIRQRYVYGDDLPSQRIGFSPWDISNQNHIPIFSDERYDTDIDRKSKNADIMTPILLLDMLHQRYPKPDSSLNNYYNKNADKVNVSIETPRYYYADDDLYNDLNNVMNDVINNIEFSENVTVGTKDYTKSAYVMEVIKKYMLRRMMMIRIREFLSTVKNNDKKRDDQNTDDDEIDELLKIRYNSMVDMEYTLMDTALGDLTRVNRSFLTNNGQNYIDVYSDNNSVNLIGPKYETGVSDQDMVQSNMQTAHLLDSENYRYKQIFKLNEYRDYFNKNTRLNPYDQSILGKSNTSESSSHNLDIHHFDVSNSDGHYSTEMINKMQEIAKQIGHFLPSKNYSYPYYDISGYTYEGMEKYYEYKDGEFTREKDEVMWVIYELLKTDKFKVLLDTNLTRMFPPYGDYSGTERPNYFTSLKTSKTKDADTNSQKDRIVLRIYNEYKKMFVHPLFIK